MSPLNFDITNTDKMTRTPPEILSKTFSGPYTGAIIEIENTEEDIQIEPSGLKRQKPKSLSFDFIANMRINNIKNVHQSMKADNSVSVWQ